MGGSRRPATHFYTGQKYSRKCIPSTGVWWRRPFTHTGLTEWCIIVLFSNTGCENLRIKLPRRLIEMIRRRTVDVDWLGRSVGRPALHNPNATASEPRMGVQRG